MQQRPQNLSVGQEVSIWGDSPAASPSKDIFIIQCEKGTLEEAI